MPVSVLVLGTLGDLVKKIIELEMLERKPSRDTTVQMYAYGKILEDWPVTDKDQVERLISSFRIQTARHIAIEQSMTELSIKVTGKIGSSSWVQSVATLTDATNRYLVSKNILRQVLTQLNSMGRYIGSPPLTMELLDGEEHGVAR